MKHRTATIAALAIASMALLAPQAEAKSPRQLDPAAMTPPLNPNFTWSCFEAGSGQICQGSNEPSYTNEQTDLSCDGRPAFVTGSGREFMTRWHDSEGRATRTSVHLDYPGDVFTLSPVGSGPTLTVRGHWNRHYTYAVPGDLSSRTLTETGAVYLANTRGGGIQVQSTGYLRWVQGEDYESIDEVHGPHEEVAGFADFDDAVCAAIT